MGYYFLTMKSLRYRIGILPSFQLPQLLPPAPHIELLLLQDLCPVPPVGSFADLPPRLLEDIRVLSIPCSCLLEVLLYNRRYFYTLTGNSIVPQSQAVAAPVGLPSLQWLSVGIYLWLFDGFSCH